MVVLKLEDYCHGCDDFDAIVTERINKRDGIDFTVSCTNIGFCRKMYYYLKNYINSKEVTIEED